jgi:hypothetical protein
MTTLLRKAALTVPLAAIALAVSSAYAASVGPSDATFYTKPATAPSGKAGDLIQYRPTTVKLGAGAPATQAWNVLYQSTDSLGKPNYVSGTVIVPTTAAAGGARQVLLYAIGTHGLAQKCAPSRQFETGNDYEASNMVAALKAGYAVLVSDYEGYLTGAKSTYLSGKSQGQAILDLFRASLNIPSVGFSSTSQVGIWGYSQGGQTAAWAGELLSSYAPELKVVGVAAGGVPADFPRTSHYLDGNIGFAFLASAVSGLGTQYPNTIGRNFNLLASPDGKAAMAKLESQCVFEALFDVENKHLADYTNDPSFTLDDIIGVPAVDDTLRAQNLGSTKIPVPLYQFHGQADEFIPLDQEMTLKRAYCAKGTPVAFDLYPGEHIMTMTQAAPTVLSWMADRFAGKTAPTTCSTTKPDPVSTNATPNGGDYLMKMDKWQLKASVKFPLLGEVPEPDTSTFNANINVTAGTVVGQVGIPDFKYPVKVLGLINFDTGLSIKPAADMTGTVKVDRDTGMLHIHGSVPMNITVTSLIGIPFGQCKTVEPVNFPLDFDGPISALGAGGIVFKGTTTIPQVKGCMISAILSALMSGGGKTYTFAVIPPAPVAN